MKINKSINLFLGFKRVNEYPDGFITDVKIKLFEENIK